MKEHNVAEQGNQGDSADASSVRVPHITTTASQCHAEEHNKGMCTTQKDAKKTANPLENGHIGATISIEIYTIKDYIVAVNPEGLKRE